MVEAKAGPAIAVPDMKTMTACNSRVTTNPPPKNATGAVYRRYGLKANIIGSTVKVQLNVRD